MRFEKKKKGTKGRILQYTALTEYRDMNFLYAKKREETPTPVISTNPRETFFLVQGFYFSFRSFRVS